MMRCLDHLANDDVGEIGSQGDDVIDSRASHRQEIAQLGWRHVDVDKILQPAIRSIHWASCSRNRMSES